MWGRKSKSDELATLDHAIWSVEVYLDDFAEDERDTRQVYEELTELYTMRKSMLQEEKGQGGNNGTQK